MQSSDPLLQPYKLKNLTLKNRIMTTSAAIYDALRLMKDI